MMGNTLTRFKFTHTVLCLKIAPCYKHVNTNDQHQPIAFPAAIQSLVIHHRDLLRLSGFACRIKLLNIAIILLSGWRPHIDQTHIVQIKAHGTFNSAKYFPLGKPSAAQADFYLQPSLNRQVLE